MIDFERALHPRSSLLALCLILLVAFAPAALVGCGGEAEEDGTEQTETEEGEPEGEAEEGSAAEGEEAEADEEEKPQRRERAVAVDASPVTRGELVLPVLAEGSIRARRSADIKFELSGRLGKINVSEGQRVRRGQRLATLDDREYQVALEEARSNYLQALGKLAVEEESFDSSTAAQRELEGQLVELEAMERRGEITRDERRAREMELGVNAVKDGAYRRELLEVRSGLATARAAEQRAELNLERTVPRAPFDGVITGLDLGPGERVQVGDLLCSVVDDLSLEADIGVLESDLAAVTPGRPVLLTVPALNETFPVTVDVVSPRIDATSRTCQVLMRIRSEDGRIKPGMFVRAAIAGEIHQDKLLVPRAAILTRDGRPMLFKIEDDHARWVYVEIGLQNDRAVEIQRVVQGGPLEPGTLVVVENHLTLTHDAKVNVRKTVDLEDPWAVYAQTQTP